MTIPRYFLIPLRQAISYALNWLTVGIYYRPDVGFFQELYFNGCELKEGTTLVCVFDLRDQEFWDWAISCKRDWHKMIQSDYAYSLYEKAMKIKEEWDNLHPDIPKKDLENQPYKILKRRKK